ncbi:MAG TPA: indole-3-glycerol phosphate synthase TrpC [Clostridiales bacterium]|nr:indole-3-glycerol phosphate synthase TrpC [Clostridiales bacterium]HOL91212.1 indole-3-glycerol phosphate synthase TrpC [Clostridiales bacterium]HPP34685.1 indole-3-glycerol phosphate synthase TrpC [Clostridiales bacterium]
MILDTLAASARLRVEAAKMQMPLDELKRQVARMDEITGRDKPGYLPNQNISDHIEAKQHAGHKAAVHIEPQHGVLEPFAFEKALKGSGISFICEVKKASPSKGIIAQDFPYARIACEYAEAGADAVSVLTEPGYFLGSDAYLEEISKAVEIPVLRKDFIVDEYQIWQSKLIGADAVLLICALLDTEALDRFIGICDELGLSALVEAHTGDEVRSALEAGARVIGVNNRDLRTFEVDINNCIKLRDLVPEGVIYVAESGINTREDILMLEKAGVDAVLIGETLMKSRDRRSMLPYLRGDTAVKGKAGGKG